MEKAKGKLVTTPAASRRNLYSVKTFIVACVLAGGLFHFTRPVTDIDQDASGRSSSAGNSEPFVFEWNKVTLNQIVETRLILTS